MNEKQDFTLKSLWKKIIAFFNAVAAINLFSDFFPSIIKWVDFLKKFLQIFSDLRDIFLYPLIILVDAIFSVEIPAWLRSYIFLGVITFSAFNISNKTICGFSYLRVLRGRSTNFFSYLLKILASIFLFPKFIFSLLNFYIEEEKADKKRMTNVYRSFGSYLRDLLLIILLFVTLNYLINLIL